jgi:hypothetical protein
MAWYFIQENQRFIELVCSIDSCIEIECYLHYKKKYLIRVVENLSFTFWLESCLEDDLREVRIVVPCIG